MNNIIIPLDFSLTSFNAAHYAADMFRGREDVTLVLYHYYRHGEDISTAENYLNSLRAELIASHLPIKTELESGDKFIECLSAFAFSQRAFMIVMGINANQPRSRLFFGSQCLQMTEQEICPVLIVPEKATFKKIDHALVTSELKFVQENPCLLAIKKILAYFKPTLHILNVDPKHYIFLAEKYREEKKKMEELMADFKPTFYFMNLFDFNDSVLTFAADKQIDMIIISPKYHDFFGKLFKTQHTKKLLHHSNVPVLAVHE
ncbi:MAG: universal stress protein [Ferruginibacter sp.]